MTLMTQGVHLKTTTMVQIVDNLTINGWSQSRYSGSPSETSRKHPLGEQVCPCFCYETFALHLVLMCLILELKSISHDDSIHLEDEFCKQCKQKSR